MVCGKWGGPEQLTLTNVPEPVPKPGEVRIDVHACSVNFADLLMIAGTYQTRPELPFVPGLEAAGSIVSAPEGSGFKPGDRVVAILWHGGYAEQAVASVQETFLLPPGVSFDVAAALTSAYVSTALALVRVANLKASEVLLVLGASGGVGLAAVQLGKALGAKVIAVASTPEKLAIAREAGADHVLGHGDWKEQVLAATGSGGVNVCFDPVGGPLFDPALSTLGWGGRYVLVGFAAGQVPSIPAHRLLVKHRAVLGSSLRYFRHHDPAALRETMDQLFAWYAQGHISPRITLRLPLEATADGLRTLAERRAIGKVVVHVRESA
ncbi:NADPH:quinone oxidoreductase family protein [Corallococcus sp. AB049A]|uniref:NADPH:quinone oxidoreductase family protein n=1 Tax=Corallococcus sp. AB049A TaxID=2316721 RepID=UPI000E9FFC38|nr:NADPH:quinone oxidoreductase family protein [Corallococcus sp. AB049A]RKH50266.1 NADPH:quinone oxidoreductase family protein [Corallococcus sp. AB050B]RKI74612.1 NADPH:quinone oxidoreductase family protein [Corallococcus sp. AB049A]